MLPIDEPAGPAADRESSRPEPHRPRHRRGCRGRRLARVRLAPPPHGGPVRPAPPPRSMPTPCSARRSSARRCTSSGSSSSPGSSGRSRCSRRSGSMRVAGRGSPGSRPPGRSAPGCCSACSASGSSGSIQLPFTLLDVWWARRYDLTEAGYLEWALGHWFELGGAFVSLCIALLVVMFLARWLGEIWWIPGAFVFVAIGAGFAFAQPYLAATKPLKDPAAEALGEGVRAEAGRLRHPDPRRGRERHDEPGERVRGRLRAFAPRRALEHDARRHVLGRRGARRAGTRDRPSLEQAHPEGDRVVRPVRAARCVGVDAGDAETRRDGRGRSDSARAPRRRSPAARAGTGAELDQPADGGRGRLEGAADDARSGRGPRALRRVQRQLPRESRPARLGARAARQPSDPGPARRDGRGVEAASTRELARAAARSTCTRARSRPREASTCRRAR